MDRKTSAIISWPRRCSMGVELIERAQHCLANGYPPVPVLRHDAPLFVAKQVNDKEGRIRQTPGKQPHGMWARKEETVYGAPPETVAVWAKLRNIDDYPNLGLACGEAGAADIDVYEPWL